MEEEEDRKEKEKGPLYTETPMNTTNNKGLANIAKKLELIYTTVDWPFKGMLLFY